MTRDEFQDVVRRALDEMPSQFHDALDNVDIQVRWAPTAYERRRLRLRPGSELFGVYLGIPLTRRGRGYSLVTPDVIVIYQRTHERFRQQLSLGTARSYWNLQRSQDGLAQARAAEVRAGFLHRQTRALMVQGQKVLFLCRSGVRSIAAAKRATELGLQAYNILEGFEGDADASAQRGKRGGWRFRGLPWRQN